MISVTKSRQTGTTYKVLNYNVYQSSNGEEKQRNEQRTEQQKDNGLNNELNINKNDKELKNEIVEILSKNNRKFDSHFIDNILISIHQNTLTLFAGLPGTGKTSLVRLLMNILSLFISQQVIIVRL